jgi:hypothetical protein
MSSCDGGTTLSCRARMRTVPFACRSLRTAKSSPNLDKGVSDGTPGGRLSVRWPTGGGLVGRGSRGGST